MISAVGSAQTTVATIQSGVNDLDTDVGTLKTCVDTLDMTVDDVETSLTLFISETESSLDEIQETVDRIEHPCGPGDWTQVVNFDITRPGTTCEGPWVLNTLYNPTLVCSSPTAATPTCSTANFQFPGTAIPSFKKVCGRVKAYAYGDVDGFESFLPGQTIDDTYVSGVILTAGSPSMHLWTFAAGFYELERTDGVPPAQARQCPCDLPDPSSIPVPDFVENQYFCEAGVNIYDGTPAPLLDDPLWDGKNCNPESTCCDFNRPPYFVNHLGATITTNQISARICTGGPRPTTAGDPGEDIAVQMIELYIVEE